MMKSGSRFITLLAAVLALALAGRSAAAPEGDVCAVHHVEMQRTELRLVYGLPSSADFEEMKVAAAKFPHGRDYVLAGCVVRPEKTVEGFLCPKCVAARAKWLRAHGRE